MKEYTINRKIYKLNIFDKLDENSAYLIGYLAGDGNFNKSTWKRKARISVGSINENTIKWMIAHFCPDTSYKSIIPVNKRLGIVTKNRSYRFTFSSKFSEVFNKYGILSLKVDRKLVNISKNLMQCYLKGLIDADGYFSGGRRKDRNRIWVKFNITHQSLSLLKSIQRFLEIELDITSGIYPRKKENCLDLTISSTKNIKKLINWLKLETKCPFVKYNSMEKVSKLLNV